MIALQQDSKFILEIDANEEMPLAIWSYLIKKIAKGRCHDCGKTNFSDHEECHHKTHAHHIISLANSGSTSLGNGECLCPKCHAKRNPATIESMQRVHYTFKSKDKH